MDKKKLFTIISVWIGVCLIFTFFGLTNNEFGKFNLNSAIKLYLSCLIYLLPIFIAGYKSSPNESGIFVLNLFFGWTIVGWLIALIWAFSSKKISILTQSLIYISLFLIIGLISSLSFHFSPKAIFPKEHLSFANTYLSQDYINKYISDYNNANVIDKRIIKNTYLFKKMVEEDIIQEEDKNKSNKEEDKNKSNKEEDIFKNLFN